MISLRRRLTLSLWFALSIVALLSAAFSYFQAQIETSELLDYQLEEIAGFLAAQSFTESAPTLILPNIDLNHDSDDDVLITVRDANGALLYASRKEEALPATGWRGLRTVNVRGVSYRMFSGDRGSMQIIVAQQMELLDEAASDAALTALLPVALTLPLLGLIVGLVIRNHLRPLRAIADGVAKRPALAFDSLPLDDLPTEVRPLVEEINRLLGRLATAVQSEQRFISDAAHSLRTPLTALRLQADVLNGSRSAQENALRLQELRAGISRAIRLSDHLLALARDEFSVDPLLVSIELDVALAECCNLYLPSAEMRGLRLTLKARSGATIPGDERYLALLAGNLIDNALRYTPSGGEVRVESWIVDREAIFEVIDEGKGLPETEFEKVFDRFHRAPDDATEGSGLGLAVVRSIVRRLGGKVSLANRRDRTGLVVRVQLPASIPLKGS